MTLIDTSAWIEFLGKTGRLDVKGRVAGHLDLGDAAYCGPIEFELLSGAREAEIGDIQRALGFSTRLEFAPECWPRAAQLERTLRSKGVTVPRDDLFVAAAALHHDVALYATDPHFALLRDRARVPLRLV
jgi:predicted nucleic acid-binding protein